MATTHPEPSTTGGSQRSTPIASPDTPTVSTDGSLRKPLLLGVILLGVVVIGWSSWAIAFDGPETNAALIFYTVKRSDLPIEVTENGSLQSQKTTELRCKVENIGRDRSGTQILTIVENGTYVKEGDLLVELDSALITDRLDEQELQTERARNQQIQATVTYENQKTQNETALAEAKLQVALDELGLQQYEDEEGGTFQLDLQTMDLNIQTAEANRLIRQTDLKGIEQLAKLGYRSKGDLEQARLAALSASSEVARQVSSRKELVDYTYRKMKMELEGKVATAKRNLEQVGRNNEAQLLQAKAAKDAADREFKKESERLTRYKKQLDHCKIIAPHDGMATYAIERDRKSHVGEGRTVHERQRIITLPNLSAMEVKTGVHESVLDSIQEGLPATITVDAFPNRKFKGSVKSVAVLADPGEWHSPDVKVYTTIVTIDEEVSELRPGMSAVVDIHVERIKDVLTVPVQAIVQIEEDNWVYVDAGGSVEKRLVTVGKTNEKFIEIREGLDERERVVLNPESLIQAETATNEIDPERDLDSDTEYGVKEKDTSKGGEDSKQPKKQKSSKPTKQPAPGK